VDGTGIQKFSTKKLSPRMLKAIASKINSELETAVKYIQESDVQQAIGILIKLADELKNLI
jgi:hypothetical protein